MNLKNLVSNSTYKDADHGNNHDDSRKVLDTQSSLVCIMPLCTKSLNIFYSLT